MPELLGVRRHFIAEHGIVTAAVEAIPNTPPPFPEALKEPAHAVSRMAAIALETRRYSSRSRSSCRRPAAVRRYSRTGRPVSDVAALALTHPLSSSFWSAG